MARSNLQPRAPQIAQLCLRLGEMRSPTIALVGCSLIGLRSTPDREVRLRGLRNGEPLHAEPDPPATTREKAGTASTPCLTGQLPCRANLHFRREATATEDP